MGQRLMISGSRPSPGERMGGYLSPCHPGREAIRDLPEPLCSDHRDEAGGPRLKAGMTVCVMAWVSGSSPKAEMLRLLPLVLGLDPGAHKNRSAAGITSTLASVPLPFLRGGYRYIHLKIRISRYAGSITALFQPHSSKTNFNIRSQRSSTCFFTHFPSFFI